MSRQQRVRLVVRNDAIRGRYFIAVRGRIQACGQTPRDALKASDVRNLIDEYGEAGRGQ